VARLVDRDDCQEDVPRAIVTDAGERVGLHIIRALGRAGVDVVATEVQERAAICPGFSSRYARETYVLPGCGEAGAAYPDRLLEIGRDGDVLVPVCLNSLLSVIENRDALSTKFRMLLPSLDALLRANDKWKLHGVAVEMGVSAPESWCPQDEDDVRALAEKVRFPVAVKFRHDQDMYLGPSERYAKVDEASELSGVWRQFSELQARPIIQQYVVGEGYGFEALYDSNGEAVATFQHKRLVEWPPEGGPSAVCQSVRIPELEQQGRKLLDGLGWRGVAMVEFRRCSETGEFYLLEINPRFWGSVSLSEAAGMNFPALYYRCARGEDVGTQTYREGVRLRFLPTFLTSMALSLRRRDLGFRRTWRQLGHLVDPRVREGLMNWDDPAGSWAYVRKNLRGSG